MRIVSAREVESWLANGEVLEKDARGPKVVALQEGVYLKIFHTRKNPLLARLQPAARRFACNAAGLQRRGIPTPDVVDVFWMDKRRGLSACIYRPLAGVSIQQIYLSEPCNVEGILPGLAAFIRSLHKAGIYFRSLHLGNVILLPDEQYGLIDFLDLQFKTRPLNTWLIERNFQHLRRYLERHNLQNFPFDKLRKLYDLS